MELKLDANKLSQLLAESFNLDIQLFVEHSLKAFNSTPAGRNIYNWATNNKVAFEGILRLLSIVVQEQKINDKSTIAKVFNFQLERLPRELRRIMLEDSANIPANNNQPTDEAFNHKFESAIEQFSEEDLRKVANLNQNQRIELVNSPTKLRKYLLEKWFPEQSQLEKNLTSSLEEFKKDIEDLFSKETWLERLAKEKKNKSNQ